MRGLGLITLLFCFADFLPGFHFQVPGYGDQNSIGDSPFASTFFTTDTWGVNNGVDNRWPNGIVPYTFSFDEPNKDGLVMKPEQAAEQIAQLEGFMNNTCVKFVPRTDETDYITFRFADGCSSHVGRVGGQQFVNMQPFCFPTIHEVIHALGFAHEEERRDRDYYMAFNWKNIKAEDMKKENFATYGTPLDPQSVVMSCCGGAIDQKEPFYILKDGSNPLTNHAFKFYSEGDRQKINRAYNCIPDDSCWDEDPFNCIEWAKDGACIDPDFAPNQCPLTCNTCKDDCAETTDKRADCKYIAATLGCNQDPIKYPGGMSKYCRNSCGLCTPPEVVKIPPMILTKCQKTCNWNCQQNTGCNPSLKPSKNLESDAHCRAGWSDEELIGWCKNRPNKNCELMCYDLGVPDICPPQCVDSDPENCPSLAATQGCFSLYNL